MANVGDKRPAPSDDDGPNVTAEAEDKLQVTPAKRPALSGFSFRPSPLHQATQGFDLKRPTLSASSNTSAVKPSATTLLQGGFLKLDSSELKPIAAATTLAPVDPASGFSSFGGGGSSTTAGPPQDGQPSVSSAAGNEGSSEQPNHTEAQGNLFLQFLNRTGSANTFSSGNMVQNSFASPSGSNDSVSSSIDATTTSAVAGAGEDSARTDVSSSDDGRLEAQSGGGLASAGVADSSGVPMSFQGPSVNLPNVQIITGEEKERKIVQVSARLYVFDVLTHTWKERGHGEIRLNDSARSEGVFQSRLVMRTLGSYRLLLNTYLWAHMKCERASQKGIRITAQHGEEGDVGVFLIMGASKDIQQLFTAIDRRIEALRRNSGSDNTDSHNSSKPLESATGDQPLPQFEDDDKESLILGEHNSSPESSPDCHMGTRTRHAPAINIATDTKQKDTTKPDDSEELGSKGKSRNPGGSIDDNGSEDRKVGAASELSSSSGPPVAPDEGVGDSDKESETATPPSSRSLSEEASTTTTISSSTDYTTENSFSQ